MDQYPFRLQFDVRDYECDLQGIVNNAHYQHYLEHARHKYLKSLGLDFAELAKAGINLVVVKVEIEYKYPLRSGDLFVVGLRAESISPVRFGFLEDIHRLDDEKLILKSRFVCIAMDQKGKPIIPDKIKVLFDDGSV